MRISRGQKRTISVILSLVMLFLMLSSAIGSFGAATATLSYNFSNTKAGYAEGTITLNGSGTYWLYWADDTKALDGFYPIATLTASGSKTHSMHAQTAIPAGATKLIAISSSSEPSNKNVSAAAAVYNVPSNKQLGHTSTQRRYRFISYSDVHFDAMYRTYKYDETHWSHALQTAADREADFMVGSGDYINNNIDYPEPWKDEWARYQKILAESDYCNPVYEAIGNHELWHDVTSGKQTFIKETGLEGSTSSAQNAYFEKTINGDHFIFMALEGGFDPKNVDEFTSTQLDWLENRLNSYSGDGHNVYVIEHSLFYKYGAGDRTNGDPYYDIPLGDGYTNNHRFKTILQNHKEAIFISGHTHIAFSAQYNYSDNGGTSAQMIHNSSVGGVRYVGSSGLIRDYKEDETEGYVVDVFDDAILFQGTNLYYNKIDPNCSYIVKTSQQMLNGSGFQGTTQATTQATTAAQTTTTSSSTHTPTAYYLKGTFNSWGSSDPFYTTSDYDVISVTKQLSAGTYQFKINNDDTWYGNGGTIEDTTKKTSNGGWVMSTSDGNCTLNATGGTYVFNFSLSNHKLNVLYSSGTNSVSSVGSGKSVDSVGSNKTYYLFGYINGADYGCESDYQNMGVYKFTNGTLTANFNQVSYVAVKEANNAAWYMTNGYQGDTATSATLYNTNNLGTNADKLRVPSGKVNFTLTENSNGTLTLSYVKDQPTTAAPTTVAQTTAAPTTAAPTTAPPVVTYTLGDVTGDGLITILDVTAIQRHIATIEYLNAAQLAAADVNADGTVSIKDATLIQEYIAHVVSSFNQSTTAAPTTVQPTTVQPTTVQPTTTGGMSDAEKTSLMNTVSQDLSRYYRYASYDSYMALKKEYRADLALKNAGNISQVDGEALNALYNAWISIVDTSNVDPASTKRTVYYEDKLGWSNNNQDVYAYIWGNQGAGFPTAWPGQKMSCVGTNSQGYKVFKLDVYDSRYKNVIFTNGSVQTQDLRIYMDSIAYYVDDGGSSPYYCKGYKFQSSYAS